MSKISELSDGGSIQSGDTLIAVRSGGNVKVTYGGTTTANIDGGTIDGTVIGGSTAAAGSFTTITASGEITANGGIAFGDNDKAAFGAGDDLQIYHDGSNSYISDQGTGDLNVLANKFLVKSASGGSTLIQADPTATNVQLFFGNAAKLATTSTGIDVTGTVVSDGLTVDGDQVINSASAAASGTRSLQFWRDSAERGAIRFDYSASTMELQADGNLFVSTGGENTALYINSNKDISFYEDTGTTAKFFWDASAESLGIGYTPSYTLDVYSGTASSNVAHFVGGAGSSRGLVLGTTIISGNNDAGVIYNANHTSGTHIFQINGTGEAARIDSSGNVGIGTSSPDRQLVINNASSFAGLKLTEGVASTDVRLTASDSGAGLFGTWSNHPLALYTNGSERARIDSSGNLLVGTTDTNPTTGTSEGIALSAGGLIMASNASDAPISLNRTTTNGAIAIFKKDGTTVGSISVTGSATAYNTSSDYRLKENVVPMDDASSRVLALKPCRFNFITDPEKTVDGFIAHEAQEVVPEAVTGTKDAMRTEEYEVSPAVYEDVIIPAVTEERLVSEAVLDEDGNELEPAVYETVEVSPERTEQKLVSEAVMGTREVPEYQGIDQSKLVPLLTAALQEALTEIASLKERITALETA